MKSYSHHAKIYDKVTVQQTDLYQVKAQIIIDVEKFF